MGVRREQHRDAITQETTQMTATIEALLAACQSPATDRTTWLVLADALQEMDREEEADLIRNSECRIEDGEIVEVPTYRLEMRDGGSDETHDFGACEEQPTSDECDDETAEWCQGGDWGTEGASIRCYWTLYAITSQGEDDVDSGSVNVEIEADHESMIADATRGDDRSCGDSPDDHDWTSEGEGGCDQNPGVWSTGGTSMSFASHCRACGLHRNEYSCGSQRNPGEHDTVSYEMPDSWCVECQSEDCDCDQDEE